ncbi:Ornithine aminotransferase [Psidium guajava]|nr:Ornithine aminotransferase [Psidium guajava]
MTSQPSKALSIRVEKCRLRGQIRVPPAYIPSPSWSTTSTASLTPSSSSSSTRSPTSRPSAAAASSLAASIIWSPKSTPSSSASIASSPTTSPPPLFSPTRRATRSRASSRGSGQHSEASSGSWLVSGAKGAQLGPSSSSSLAVGEMDQGGVTHHSPTQVLKNFSEIRFLRIELPSGELGLMVEFC